MVYDPDLEFMSSWGAPSGTALVPTAAGVMQGSVYDPGWAQVLELAHQGGLTVAAPPKAAPAPQIMTAGLFGGVGSILPGAQTQVAPVVEPGTDLATIPAAIAAFFATGAGAQLLAGLGGLALGGVGSALGLGGGNGGGGLFGAQVGETGVAMPWETPAGEGFIAPWSTSIRLPNGQEGQLGVGYPSIGIAKSWSNGRGGSLGTVTFFKMLNGSIVYNNLQTGAWGKYRPKKHIVISSNPRLKSLAKLDRVYKRVGKMVRKFAPKPPKQQQVSSRYLSAAEKKLIKAGG